MHAKTSNMNFHSVMLKLVSLRSDRIRGPSYDLWEDTIYHEEFVSPMHLHKKYSRWSRHSPCQEQKLYLHGCREEVCMYDTHEDGGKSEKKEKIPPLTLFISPSLTAVKEKKTYATFLLFKVAKELLPRT